MGRGKPAVEFFKLWAATHKNQEHAVSDAGLWPLTFEKE